jgi:hypothetical protein
MGQLVPLHPGAMKEQTFKAVADGDLAPNEVGPGRAAVEESSRYP